MATENKTPKELLVEHQFEIERLKDHHLQSKITDQKLIEAIDKLNTVTQELSYKIGSIIELPKKVNDIDNILATHKTYFVIFGATIILAVTIVSALIQGR